MSAVGDILLTTARYRGYSAEEAQGGVSANRDAQCFVIDGKPVFITGIEAIGTQEEIFAMLERKLEPFPSKRGS